MCSAADIRRFMTVYPMRAGDALVFDVRAIHGSEANRSGRRRTAATIGFRPSDASLLHYVRYPSQRSTVTQLRVDKAFFLGYSAELQDERNVEQWFARQGYAGQEIPYSHVPIGLGEIERVAHPRSRRAGRIRTLGSRARPRLRRTST
jgi:ectoine hydroxylase-related dioxygenase (phytanoyl-CoA dioxygenase family)